MEDRLPIEFAENTEDRIPVILALDTSDSMLTTRKGQDRSPMKALEGALDVIQSSISSDPLARKRADISFLVYGTEVHDPTPFATVDAEHFALPVLQQNGLTSTNQAIMDALNLVEARKEEYKAAGIKYYRPIIFLLTDGLPTDPEKHAEAVQQLQAALDQKKTSFYTIAIEGADLEQLATYPTSSPTQKPLELDGTKFEEFFTWLSASLSSVSQSRPGEGNVAIPAPTEWAIGV